MLGGISLPIAVATGHFSMWLHEPLVVLVSGHFSMGPDATKTLCMPLQQPHGLPLEDR